MVEPSLSMTVLFATLIVQPSKKCNGYLVNEACYEDVARYVSDFKTRIAKSTKSRDLTLLLPALSFNGEISPALMDKLLTSRKYSDRSTDLYFLVPVSGSGDRKLAYGESGFEVLPSAFDKQTTEKMLAKYGQEFLDRVLIGGLVRDLEGETVDNKGTKALFAIRYFDETPNKRFGNYDRIVTSEELKRRGLTEDQINQIEDLEKQHFPHNAMREVLGKKFHEKKTLKLTL